MQHLILTNVQPLPTCRVFVPLPGRQEISDSGEFFVEVQNYGTFS